MKILVTGRGTSGSWKIRGDQLGNEIGASVIPNATARDCHGHNLAVLVKRPTPGILQALREAGLPIVWDVVDSWPQPAGNDWVWRNCMDWARAEVAKIKPMAIVAATRAMAEDFGAFGVPVLALPHHAMPWARPAEIRKDVGFVAYEGGGQYLGKWESILQEECHRRGWRLGINPPSLGGADIVVAMREQRGYAPRYWKSNVKLANAQGWGLPCVMNREAGYIETSSGAECWADSPKELSKAFDLLDSHTERRQRAAVMSVRTPRLADVAGIYREWLNSL